MPFVGVTKLVGLDVTFGIRLREDRALCALYTNYPTTGSPSTFGSALFGGTRQMIGVA